MIAIPASVQAQTAVLVVQLPFQGDATTDLLTDVEDTVRNVLQARGIPGPDRSTVRAALGASIPTDATSIVSLGRSMGATHVLAGRVTPLTGQFNLELRLYEVSTGRMAVEHRNVGIGHESPVIDEMVSALFAPGAMQPSPEERAREQQRREEEQRAQVEAARRAEEERRRAEQTRRQHEQAERRRRVYHYAEAGPIAAGGAIFLGGRITAVETRPGAPRQPESLVAGVRIEGGYAVAPAVGLEVGGAALFMSTPTHAFAVGPSVRLSLPVAGYVPLRGSAGGTVGIFQGFSGARATAAWLALDLRGEYDFGPVTVFAGGSLDLIPGVVGSIGAIAGMRMRFGESARSNGGTQP